MRRYYRGDEESSAVNVGSEHRSLHHVHDLQYDGRQAGTASSFDPRQQGHHHHHHHHQEYHPSHHHHHHHPAESMDQQFAEFLQQEANNPAFAAYHYHQDTDDEHQPSIDDIIETDDEQTVVSEITTFTSASLFRGPLYQRPTAVLDDSLNDEEIADLFNSNNTTTVGGSSNTRGWPTGEAANTSDTAAGVRTPERMDEEYGRIKNDNQTREAGNEWITTRSSDPRLHQASSDSMNTQQSDNHNLHKSWQFHPKQQQQQQPPPPNWGEKIPSREKLTTSKERERKSSSNKPAGGGGQSLPRLKEIVEEENGEQWDNKELIVGGGKPKKTLPYQHSDLKCNNNDGKILLKTATAKMQQQPQQPGAYAATSNSNQDHGEAIQVPDYRNALGLTTTAATTTTTNTAAKQGQEGDTNDKDEKKNNNKESVITATVAAANNDLTNDGWCKNQRRRLVIAAGAVVVVVLIAIIILPIVLPMALPQDNNNTSAVEELDSFSGGQKEEEDQQQQLLDKTNSFYSVVPNLTQATIRAIERDKFSPQFLAYDWVSRDYNWDTYQDWRKQQRFALMCIYYAIVPLNLDDFQSPIVPGYHTNECNWMKLGGRRSYCSGSDEDDDDNDDGGVGKIVLFTIEKRGFVVPSDAQLPPQIGYLSQLKSFVFNNVPIRGTLDEFLPPQTLERFPPSVEEIDFRGAKLHGSIPSTLGLLTSLTSLDLRSLMERTLGVNTPDMNEDLFRNELSSTIPTQLGLLSNLHNLYLSGNLLSGSIPPELGRQQLPELVNFQIEDNPHLEPPIPNGFCSNDGNTQNNDTVVPFESLQTDWCDNPLDCCGGM